MRIIVPSSFPVYSFMSLIFWNSRRGPSRVPEAILTACPNSSSGSDTLALMGIGPYGYALFDVFCVLRKTLACQ